MSIGTTSNEKSLMHGSDHYVLIYTVVVDPYIRPAILFPSQASNQLNSDCSKQEKSLYYNNYVYKIMYISIGKGSNITP